MSFLSEIDFLRSEIATLQRKNLDLEYENKKIKREIADSKVFAYLKYKDTSPFDDFEDRTLPAPEPERATPAIVFVKPVVEAEEDSRIESERARLQSLWISFKLVGPPPKFLKSLRRGIKEAGKSI